MWSIFMILGTHMWFHELLQNDGPVDYYNLISGIMRSVDMIRRLNKCAQKIFMLPEHTFHILNR